MKLALPRLPAHVSSIQSWERIRAASGESSFIHIFKLCVYLQAKSTKAVTHGLVPVFDFCQDKGMTVVVVSH